MKVLIDEHLPPALAHALKALFRGEHEIFHLREKYGPGVKDVEWIVDLSRDDRWIIISADRRITRNKAEYSAFRSSRLIGFFMARSVYKGTLIRQTVRILQLWEGIVELSERMEGGAMFELPGTSNRIKQLKP